MVWTRVSPFLALLAVYAQFQGVSARRGGGSSGTESSNAPGRGSGVADNSNATGLNLDSFNTAVFSFYVLFAAIATIQTLQALRLLFQRNGRAPHYAVNTGIMYRIFLVLAPLTLIAAYTMGAIFVAVDRAEDNYYRRSYARNFTAGFYACIDFLPQLAEIFFAAALLIIIHHRARLNQITYWGAKAAIDGLLVLLLLICSVATTAIATAPVNRANFTLISNAYGAFTHLYIAFYVFMAINIVGMAMWVRHRIRHLVVQDQMLRSIALFICPWIIIRAIYKLIYDILIWIPRDAARDIDYRALSFATLIILGFTFAFMIGVAVRLGLQPKVHAMHQQQGTVIMKGN